MDGLFRGYPDPIVKKCTGRRLATKSRHEVPGEIDGVKFDMGEGMQQRDPSGL
jgi:hypothetical protein